MKDRLLITGGTGFIGRHLLPLVRGSFELHIATRREIEPAADLTGHAVDLRDSDACRILIESVRPTHLIHLAWSTAHGHFWSDPSNVDWLESGITLMRAFCAHGGRRAILAGTCAEYAPGEPLCNEATSLLAPNSLYGAMKLALFQAATVIAEAGGSSLAWARIFHPFGAGEDSRRLVPSIVDAILRGESFVAQNPGLILDFVDVRDLANAFYALLHSDLRGAINLGSGESMAIGSLVSLAYDLAGKVPPTMPATSESALLPDLHRMRAELGFSPHIDLRQGLLDYLAAARPLPRSNKELT